MMSIGVLSAFLLNLIFRVGATRSVVLEFEKSDESVDNLEKLLRGRGRAWSVAPDVMDRAVSTTQQVFRHLADAGLMAYGLADFLTGVYPDRMEARSEGQNAEIRLIFGG